MQRVIYSKNNAPLRQGKHNLLHDCAMVLNIHKKKPFGNNKKDKNQKKLEKSQKLSFFAKTSGSMLVVYHSFVYIFW